LGSENLKFKRMILVLTVTGGLVIPVLVALAVAGRADEAEHRKRQWESGDRAGRVSALRWFNDHFLRPGMPKFQVEEKLGVGERRTLDERSGCPSYWYSVPKTNRGLVIFYEEVGGIQIVRSFHFLEGADGGNSSP
jgi:hypothetical protein